MNRLKILLILGTLGVALTWLYLISGTAVAAFGWLAVVLLMSAGIGLLVGLFRPYSQEDVDGDHLGYIETTYTVGEERQ